MRDKPLLFDLAQLLEAGIAPLEALNRLQAGRTSDDRSFTLLTTDLRRGRSLAGALREAGFASRLETEILKVAEGAGKLSEALRLVGANFERRTERTQRLRMRLWLPNFVLFAALAVQVVRATTAGVPLSGALVGPGIIAIVVAGTSQLLLFSVARDASGWLSLGWRLGLNNSSNLFRQFFEQTFYTLFAWQTDAGLDYAAGAKTLSTLIDHPSYTRRIGRYRQHITSGEAVLDALSRTELLVSGELEQVIKVGEQSGRLAPALQHYLILQGERLDRTIDTIYAWLPRIYYFVVLAIGATLLI